MQRHAIRRLSIRGSKLRACVVPSNRDFKDGELLKTTYEHTEEANTAVCRRKTRDGLDTHRMIIDELHLDVIYLSTQARAAR